VALDLGLASGTPLHTDLGGNDSLLHGQQDFYSEAIVEHFCQLRVLRTPERLPIAVLAAAGGVPAVLFSSIYRGATVIQ